MKEEVVSPLNGVVYRSLSCFALWDLYGFESAGRFTVKPLSEENTAGLSLNLHACSRTPVCIVSIISICRASLQRLWEIKSSAEFDRGGSAVGVVDSCKPGGKHSSGVSHPSFTNTNLTEDEVRSASKHAAHIRVSPRRNQREDIGIKEAVSDHAEGKAPHGVTACNGCLAQRLTGGH